VTRATVARKLAARRLPATPMAASASIRYDTEHEQIVANAAKGGRAMWCRADGQVRIGARGACLLAAAGMLAALSATARAEPTVHFVFDVSGSMWGRIDGDTPKIEVARRVMGDLLRDLPPTIAVGMTAYGHRRKGDCADIEDVQPPQAGAGPSIADAMQRLVPRGKTPIADSLQRVGEALSQIEDETSIVLVSDGIETCGGDPCAVAAALHGRDVKLKVHVVGYDVSADAEAVAQLRCVAEQGGGQYFPADDVAGLSEALTTITTSVVAQQPVAPPSPPPAPTVAAVSQGQSTSKVIVVAGPGTVELAAAPWVQLPPYWWKLVDPETGEPIGETKQNSLKVKPGRYQVAWRQDPSAPEVLLPEVIEVRAGQTTPAPIATGLRLVAPAGMAPYYWKLVDDAGAEVAQYKTLAAVPVPGGGHHVLWRQTPGHDEVDLGLVELRAGELTEVLLDQGVNVALPEWMQAPPYTIRFTDPQGRAVQVEGPGASVLGPGRYQVGFRLTPNHLEVPWGELKVPEQGFVDPAFTSGLAFLTTGAAPYYVWAVNLDSGQELYVQNLWGPLPLPPGRYRVDLRPDPSSDRFTIIEEVPIGPGELIQVQM
jgi:Ca-activated chloride channel family protein